MVLPSRLKGIFRQISDCPLTLRSGPRNCPAVSVGWWDVTCKEYLLEYNFLIFLSHSSLSVCLLHDPKEDSVLSGSTQELWLAQSTPEGQSRVTEWREGAWVQVPRGGGGEGPQGPEAFMRPGRALCRREPLGEPGPRPRVRSAPQVLGPHGSPIKETASPPGRPGSCLSVPHTRGLLVFRVWGAFTRTCVDGVLFPPLRAGV